MMEALTTLILLYSTLMPRVVCVDQRLGSLPDLPARVKKYAATVGRLYLRPIRLVIMQLADVTLVLLTSRGVEMSITVALGLLIRPGSVEIVGSILWRLTSAKGQTRKPSMVPSTGYYRIDDVQTLQR